MSTYGELYQDAMEEEWFASLYEEHAKQARDEFRAERLSSYYAAQPDLAETAFAVLADARQLRTVSAAACLVRATSALELGIKNALLRPIVYGLVHSEALATVITDMTLGHQALDRYKDLLVVILKEHGGVDLTKYLRPAATQNLWAEMRESQTARNHVVHAGATATNEQCDVALGVAHSVPEVLFVDVVGKLGFHLHGATVCDDPHVSAEIEQLLRHHIG